jgi:rubrerythrin
VVNQQAGDASKPISDIEYNLVTTLSNLLQAHEVLAKYADDAQKAGDTDCSTIFRTLRDQNAATAQQLRGALGRHLSGGQ